MLPALRVCRHLYSMQSILHWSQGVVAESSGLKDRIREVVTEAHSRGLFLFTYGNENNDISYYQVRHLTCSAVLLLCAWSAAVPGTQLSTFDSRMAAYAY